MLAVPPLRASASVFALQAEKPPLAGERAIARADSARRIAGSPTTWEPAGRPLR